LAVPVTLLGKPVTFQAAWRRLYTIEYRENIAIDREPLAPEGPPALNIRYNSDLGGSVDLLSLAGAVKVTPRLALGASFNLWRGDWAEEVFVRQTTPGSPDAPLFGRSLEENSTEGENLSLGLLLTYPRWSVGLLHQSPLHADYSTSVSFESSGGVPAQQQGLDGTLRFARSIGIGAAWRPVARWTLALDLTWDDWTGTLLQVPSTQPVNLFDGLPEDRTSTRDTVGVNAGAECLFQKLRRTIGKVFGGGA
jgi:hypothetical protein